MNKPTLVLLPGMMCDARLFQHQIKHFEPDYRIVVGELFDHDSLDGLVNGVLAQVGDADFSLVGFSMGAVVAMAICRACPERVQRLALIGANPFADTPERQQQRDEQVEQVRVEGLRQLVVDELKPAYFTGSHNYDAGLRPLVVDMAMDAGDVAFFNQSRALRNRKTAETVLKDFAKPTLLMCGAEDQVCPVSHHEAMAEWMPQAVLDVIPGVGHLCLLEAADAVNANLDQWLEP